MSGSSNKLLSFGGAAGALGIAAVVARVACPGGCATCTTCATGVVPAVGSMIAVGAALGGSYFAKKGLSGDSSKRSKETPL